MSYNREDADRNFTQWLNKRVEELGKDDLTIQQHFERAGLDYTEYLFEKMPEKPMTEYEKRMVEKYKNRKTVDVSTDTGEAMDFFDEMIHSGASPCGLGGSGFVNSSASDSGMPHQSYDGGSSSSGSCGGMDAGC